MNPPPIMFFVRNSKENKYSVVMSEIPIPVREFCEQMERFEKRGFDTLLTSVEVYTVERDSDGFAFVRHKDGKVQEGEMAVTVEAAK